MTGIIAKQSTALTLIVGPILDSAGAEYAAAVIGDLSISKNGAALTALAAAATLTVIANGQYTLVLTTTNTDTLGVIQISCNKSTYQMHMVERQIVPATVYDAIVTNAVNATGGFIGATGAVTGVSGVLANQTNIMAGTITTVTNLTNLPAITANWLTAAGLASDAVAEIQAGLATAAAVAAEAVKTANIQDGVAWILADAAGAIAAPQTATATAILTVFGATYTVQYAGLTSTGVRTAPTLSKV